MKITEAHRVEGKMTPYGFKEYPRIYEDFQKVGGNNGLRGNFSMDKVTVHGKFFKTTPEYVAAYESSARAWEKLVFESYVRLIWLGDRFVYDGRRRTRQRPIPGQWFGNMIGHFYKGVLQFEQKFVNRNHAYRMITRYIPLFFPYFDSESPIEHPELFAYPFKHVTLAHMHLVFDMDDVKMQLLKKAEDEQMRYYDFLNYVVNYALCTNDDLGRERYKILYGFSFPTMIKDVDYVPMGKMSRGVKKKQRKKKLAAPIHDTKRHPNKNLV